MEEANSTAEIHNCNTMPTVYFDSSARCDTTVYFDSSATCDTTREMAQLAFQAGKAGWHSGFRTARSHFEVRTMQQDAGFIAMNENGAQIQVFKEMLNSFDCTH